MKTELLVDRGRDKAFVRRDISGELARKREGRMIGNGFLRGPDVLFRHWLSR